MNQESIPVALKAGLVNNPPRGIEGQLYAEISRSKAAPQGICVANSSGKVLAWALSFDTDADVPRFLDYALERFQESPDATQPVVAERFMKFPSQKMANVSDTTGALTIPQAHNSGDRCPAEPTVEADTLVGRIVGRPLDSDGQPIAKTSRQEDYMEARFEVSPGQQRQLIRALAQANDDDTIPVPAEFSRALVSHAYLGQLDVNPLGGRQVGGRTDSESITFHAKRTTSEKAVQNVRITGTSDVSGGAGTLGVQTDGRSWEHRVQLVWEGYLDIEGDRVTQLILTAEGTERLRWGSARFQLLKEPDIAHLMAGHPIDLDCHVRYGLSATPAPAKEVAAPGTALGNNQAAAMQQQLRQMKDALRRLRAAGNTDRADQVERQIKRIEQELSR